MASTWKQWVVHNATHRAESTMAADSSLSPLPLDIFSPSADTQTSAKPQRNVHKGRVTPPPFKHLKLPPLATPDSGTTKLPNLNIPPIECPPQATNECFRFLHAVQPLPNNSGDRPLPGCIARAHRGEAMVEIQASVV